MERVVERGNRLAALRRVQQNGGSPGIDGMTVEEWPRSLCEHWPQIREARLAGTSRPQPAKRVEPPKPGGGVRNSACQRGWTGTCSRRCGRWCSRSGRQPAPTAARGVDRGGRPPRRLHARSGR